MNTKHILFIVLLALVAYSCKSSLGGAQLGPKPQALGKINEIVVIADSELWEGAVGDTFKFYFGSAYPIMPTPEPIFDIRHFTPQQLQEQELRKELRTYVILSDLNDTSSKTTELVVQDLGQNNYDKSQADNTFNTSVGRDKWASGQVLFYLFANGENKLNEVIGKSFSAIATKVNMHDNKILKQATYSDALNIGNTTLMSDKYNMKLDMPSSFKKIVDKENVSWFRKDQKEYILNLVFDKDTYSKREQLSPDRIKEWIEEFAYDNITSDFAGSRLVVNDEDLPVFEYTKQINGAYTTELRGTWEMTKEFLAGPFFAYAMLNEQANEVVYVFAFISAPGKDKRDKMQQLEYMVQSINWLPSDNSSIE